MADKERENKQDHEEESVKGSTELKPAAAEASDELDDDPSEEDNAVVRTDSVEEDPHEERDQTNLEEVSRELLEDDDDEENEEDTSSDDERQRRMSRAERILCQEIPEAAARADDNLRAALTGAIKITITNRDQSFFVDWTKDDIDVRVNADEEGDCHIALEEKVLLRLRDGKLNPQIALLSEKVAVTGNSSLAVFFCNLFSQGSRGR